MSVLLSIDPGTHKLGWALWNGDELRDFGVFQAKASLSSWERMEAIMNQFTDYLEPLQTDTAVEVPEHYGRNKVHTTLSHMVGALFQCTISWGGNWVPYNPSTVKAACVLRGTHINARDKAAVRLVIEQLYPQTQGADEDAIDAIAVGHCHLANVREKEVLGDVRL